MKVVPDEPTEAMLAAVRHAIHPTRPDGWDGEHVRIYKLMLSAAPPAEEGATPRVDAEAFAAKRDSLMTWDEVTEELIWENYSHDDPDDKPIDAERLEWFCKRFPHFEEWLREYVASWNERPRITPEMLEATEVTQEEVDSGWRRAKQTLDFYRKLRQVEKERDELSQSWNAAIESAAKVCEEWALENDIKQSEAHGMDMDDAATYHKGARVQLARCADAIRALLR